MDEIKKLVSSMIEKNASDDEIADAILQVEDVKKELGAKEIADLIIVEKKAFETKMELKKHKAAQESDSMKKKEELEISEKVNKLVDERLKSINVLSRTGYDQKITKVFDYKTGAVKPVDQEVTKSSEFVNKLFRAVAAQDKTSAFAISKEIEQEYAEEMKKDVTGVVSDVNNRGGYAVPPEFEMSIRQNQYNESGFANLCNRQTVVYNNKIFPVTTEIGATWIGSQSAAAAEKTQTYSQVDITLYRMGGFANISNTILRMPSVDVSGALSVGIGSALAKALDTQLVIGNVTNASDKMDGIVFSSKSTFPTAVALADLDELVLTAMTEKSDIVKYANQNALVWLGNTKLLNRIGTLKDTAGNPLFPGFYTSQAVSSILGKRFVVNNMITSVLDVGGDASTGGTDDVLILVDPTNIVLAERGLRIDSTDAHLFTEDMTSIRFIQDFGHGQIMSGRTVVQELTN